MLAWLIYCSATGRFGSRTLAAATPSDGAGRYRGANLQPDHASLGEFRGANAAAFRAACVSVRPLAQQLPLTKVGAGSVEGPKSQANASQQAAVSAQRAGERIALLALEGKARIARAQQAEATEARETLEIPAERTRRQKRVAAVKAARQVIAQRGQALAAAPPAEDQAQPAQRPAQRAAGQTPRGPEPAPPGDAPAPKAPDHVTDPPSRILKAGHGPQCAPADKAPAAVAGPRLIVGERVRAAPNDQAALGPAVAAIRPVVAEPVTAGLADSGFYRAAAVATGAQRPGGEPTGIQVDAAGEQPSQHKTVADWRPPPEPVAPDPAVPAKAVMAHRLNTERGKALDPLRQQTVAPGCGMITAVMGFRRCRLRGRVPVALEWPWVGGSDNLQRRFTLKNLAVAG